MKDLLIHLSCAFSSAEFTNQSYVNGGQEREDQYREGLAQFFRLHELYKINKNVSSPPDHNDIYIVDNTLENSSKINSRILEVVPNEVNYIVSHHNEYGKNNKGSGCIEQFELLKDVMPEYKYIWFSSARSVFRNFSLFERFKESPENLFRKWHEGQFFTNTFIIETAVLLQYIDYRSPQSLSDGNICFESDLYDYMNDYHNASYVRLDKIGIDWNDELASSQAGEQIICHL